MPATIGNRGRLFKEEAGEGSFGRGRSPLGKILAGRFFPKGELVPLQAKIHLDDPSSEALLNKVRHARVCHSERQRRICFSGGCSDKKRCFASLSMTSRKCLCVTYFGNATLMIDYLLRVTNYNDSRFLWRRCPQRRNHRWGTPALQPKLSL